MDILKVRVETEPGLSDAAASSAQKALASQIKTLIGISVGVEVIAAGLLPRSGGKAVRIIDNRNISEA